MEAMEDKEVKQLVNECFQKNGLPKVKKFASEFADGSKYLSSPNTCFVVLF